MADDGYSEKMPQFPGGEKGLSTFIYEHIKYPAEAIKNKEEGKVIVLFVISKTGKVEKSEITRGGISPNLNTEVLRVVNMLPDFKPGEQNGEKVKIYYTLPVIFQLKPCEKKSFSPIIICPSN